MPLHQTIEHEEMLEVIRLEGHALCYGINENAVGACSKLVFALIDEMFPDNAPLIPSGFQIIPLDPKLGDPNDAIGTTHHTLDLPSSIDLGQSTNHGPSDSMRLVLHSLLVPF
ncbi:hypothetical protein Hanom_Chr09g00800601 [Helianthus anomalus]